MSICDFLFSADMLVAEPRTAVAKMINSIGLPPPGPRAFVDFEESGWDCAFALVNKDWAVGPTRLEVIGPKRYPGTPEKSRGQSMADVQGEKPCKTHATVVATSEIERLAEHVARLGLRHWLEEEGENGVPFTRLWMGVSEAEPCDYEPEADAGLIVELIPSDSSAFSPKLFRRPPPEPVDPVAGQMIRILSRAFLVDDLDATLRTLERNLLWEPSGAIAEDRDAGYRYALLAHDYAQGATLKLIEPLDPDRPEAAFLARWGPSPFTIRIAVHDLAAKCDDLQARRTAFDERPATAHEPERLAIDPRVTAGMPFELVEHIAAQG
jgi:hypothetical protein